jgi:hypothetical protein
MAASFAASFRIFKEPTVEDQEQQHSVMTRLFIIQSVFLFLVAGFCTWAFSGVIPYSLFEFWSAREGGVMDWLWAGRWAFAWGAGLTALVSLLTRNSHYENSMAERLMRLNAKVSMRAGFFEEVIFRWLLLLIAFPVLFALNFVFGGFAGFGLVEMLYTYIMSPLANWTSFGMLESHLLHENWLVGAAIVFANAKFRDGHKYLGIVGLVNSWFIGLFFFVLMFRFGLPAAILVHFVYDLLIFLVRYIDQVIERSRG